MADRRVSMIVDPVFLFVVGSTRSGTTLLRGMFDSHPQLAVPWESHFITQFSRNRARYEHGLAFDQSAFVDDLFLSAFRHWGVDRERIERALTKRQWVSYPDAVRAVFADYAAARGKSRYGDKTPAYVREITLIAAMFPEARFIHIIRDGRNVALSLLTTSWGPDSVAEAAMAWKTSVTMGRDAGRRLTADRYREVRYEALVRQPVEHLRNLCDFAEIEWDPRMLRFHERAAQLVAAGPCPEFHQN